MDAQDFRSLQEAYMEVVENQQLDGYKFPQGERPLPYGLMMKKSNKLAVSKDKKNQNRAAKIYLAANAPTGPRVKGVKVREQVDLYDIILSHLLDEGYAETPEAAEVIMVNMSEEWRDDIVEGKNPLPISKMKKKEHELLDSPKATKKFSDAIRTDMGSKEREAFSKDMGRWHDIHDTRRSVSTRGGKRPLPMPEVGRYKPKYED